MRAGISSTPKDIEPPSSGSGASFLLSTVGRTEKRKETMDEDEYTFAAEGAVTSHPQSTPKIPPGFDGRSSWFAFEEAIDDWVDITILLRMVTRQSTSHS